MGQLTTRDQALSALELFAAPAVLLDLKTHTIGAGNEPFLHLLEQRGLTLEDLGVTTRGEPSGGLELWSVDVGSAPVELHAHVREVELDGRRVLTATVTAVEDDERREDTAGGLNAHQLLEVERERLRSTIASMRDLIFSLDEEGRFTHVYFPPDEDILYAPKEQFIGKEFHQILPPAVADQLSAAITEVRGGQTISAFDYCLPMDGGPRWYNAAVSSRRGAEGEFSGTTLVCRDVTSRKAAEEELLRIKKTIDGVSDAIGMSTPEGDHFYQNAAFTQLFGYDDPEALSRNGGPLALYADLRVGREVFDTIGRGERWSGEVEMRSRQGRHLVVWLRASAVKDEEGNPIALVGIHSDITSRKQDAARLALFRQFAESSVQGLGWADLEGRVHYVNPRLRQMAKMSEERRLDQMSFMTPFGADTRARIGSEIIPTVLTKGHWGGELELIAADDTRLPIHANIFLIREDHGAPKYMACTVEDISERKRAEEELQAAIVQAQHLRQKAEAASIAKSEFVANMSHEIRTPMNGVIGMTGLLMDTPLDDDQQDFVTTIRSSAEALLAIINDVLDFSKVEAGKLEISFIDFSLATAVDEVNDLLAFKARAKGLSYECRLDPQIPPYLRGDAGRLRQVLTNLLGNAIKFTATGRIELEAQLASTVGSSVALRFSVSDTGVGVPPERRASIFGAFEQADGGTARQFGGTGLGLAISKQLVTLMGGDIDVTSEVGVGSTFSFALTFPVGQAPSDEDVSPLKERVGRPSTDRRARVLVAEDNLTNQKVALKILTKLGYVGEAVSNGQEALDALGMAPFDLVLMDVQMPVLDGFEATEAVRSGEAPVRNPKVPIVAMTANAMKGDRERCLQAGMDDYLPKPVHVDDLEKVLRRWLVPAPEATLDVEQVPFDRAGLVDRVFGDEKLANEILTAYLDETAGQVDRLRAGLGDMDDPEVGRQARALERNAKSVGAQELAGAARRLASAERHSFPELVEELGRCFDSFRGTVTSNRR